MGACDAVDEARHALDVAVRAGVSTTTASYILNDRSAQMRISAATERRVRAAVADLDYRPNRSARTLRTANTATIGVISDFVAGGPSPARCSPVPAPRPASVDHVLDDRRDRRATSRSRRC